MRRLFAAAGLLLALQGAALAGGLWPQGGEVSEPPPGKDRYQKLCAEARAALRSPQDSGPEALRAAAAAAREASALDPENPEAWTLLGRALLELGSDKDARPALVRAQQLGAGDTRVALALGLLSAQEGDLPAALELYQRLIHKGLAGAQLVRRAGDVLMAMGRLSEAVAMYRRVCPVDRAPVYSSGAADMARACYALAVALDRDERLAASAHALQRALMLDRAQRSLAEGDFVPAADRDYYLALLAGRRGLPCVQKQALQRYLAPPGRAGEPAYAQRARARLERLQGQCGPGAGQGTDLSTVPRHHPQILLAGWQRMGYSAFIDEPLGIHPGPRRR